MILKQRMGKCGLELTKGKGQKTGMFILTQKYTTILIARCLCAVFNLAHQLLVQDLN